MKRHWRYLVYVLRHKRFVFEAGLRYGVPLWQLVIHDWSKFRPVEWLPYAEWFYGYEGGSWVTVLRAGQGLGLTGGDLYRRAQECKAAFERAFLLHLHASPHHHQHWVLPAHGDKPAVVYEMPERYVREMVADWAGAGRAITGRWEVVEWYGKNKDTMVLGTRTRDLVERLLMVP